MLILTRKDSKSITLLYHYRFTNTIIVKRNMKSSTPCKELLEKHSKLFGINELQIMASFVTNNNPMFI